MKLSCCLVSLPQPLIADIMSSLGKATSLPADFEGTQKLRLWLKKLNDLRAADEIEEDECRQVRVAHKIIISPCELDIDLSDMG
jgi:VPS28 protein